MLKPAMVAVPLVGSRSVASIRRVVVFPAPFAPRRPKIFPGSQVRLIFETALTKPRFLSRKVFVRFSATITVFGVLLAVRKVRSRRIIEKKALLKLSPIELFSSDFARALSCW